MQYRECFQKGQAILAETGVEEAALDARFLLEYVCGTQRHDLLVHGDKEVTEEQVNTYFQYIERRANRIPLQHITGTQNFMGLDFAVNSHVLIPRQDTEILVEEVLRQMTDGMRILDMCTGSGCILISLLHYSNWCEGVGADNSVQALEMAEKNAASLLTKDASYHFILSDLFENVEGKFDIIVSNPPYIRSNEIGSLMPEVKDHEPRQALDGAEDGLFFYRRIVQESQDYLVKGGMLYFEIGYDQAEQVIALMQEAGFWEIQVIKDYAGLDRVVFGRR